MGYGSAQFSASFEAGPAFVPTPDVQVRLTAMSAMASTLAHDLMQPLTAALNYLHVSSKQLEGCDGVLATIEMIESAAKQTMKAVEMIRRMRGFAIEGKVTGRRESLRNMVEQVRADLIVEERLDAELEVMVPADANYVLADRIQIELVLSNLLANAAEALEGRAFRKIELNSRRSGDEILVVIRDSGPGLSEETYAHLFDPLFTTKSRGSGLGLAICKAIVEAHGGRLWAGVPSQSGAVFYLTLPAAERF